MKEHTFIIIICRYPIGLINFQRNTAPKDVVLHPTTNETKADLAGEFEYH
jgi:hypothetical protein